MDNLNKEHENMDKKGNNNAEYLSTKCRVTKPPPPKPATNPLQFIKVNPCPLYQKAQEQIKKVEEVKTARKEVREEAEDWQQNLDNWKSSRRKQQERIIERVVEVKKLEQEEHERSRRKNKTFSEMMEERSKGRHKFNIPIYNDDDSNDLSDYGIGSSSSKTNSIKDVDTDDNSSVLDEKDFASNKESSASNQSQSEDETTSKSKITKKDNLPEKSIYTSIYVNVNKSGYTPAKIRTRSSSELFNSPSELSAETEQYTYEGAIQDYRTRIRSKINIDESIFKKSQPHDFVKARDEVETIVPKGNIFKRKEIFEAEKRTENEHVLETNRRLSETFSNTQSIKDRLKSLEQCADQSLKSVEKTQTQISVKERLQNFNKQNETDTKNNNKPKPPIKIDYTNNNNSTGAIRTTMFDKSEEKHTTNWSTKDFDRSSSPEAEMYMNELNMFNRDLNLMYGNNDLDEYVRNAISSDREDSGIHTADVSCAVSQSDEPYEEIDPSATIPKCIEKLSVVKENETDSVSKDSIEKYQSENLDTYPNVNNNSLLTLNLKQLTEDLLSSERKDSESNVIVRKEHNENQTTFDLGTAASNQTEFFQDIFKREPNPSADKKPVIYENVNVKDSFPVDFIFESTVTKLEPPKVKPPPPPLQDECDGSDEIESSFKRINSTKRIKKEMHIKRSSFLGLKEPTDDQIDPDIPIDKPPDINSFLQKESRLEKTLYKKMQGNRDGGISEVESQDSGLDIDRGRLSSDTWCSSIVDSSTPVHDRQDSEQTSSFTSEEEEIIQKEREIIELVEKEEKSRDSDYSSQTTLSPVNIKGNVPETYDTLGSEKFDRPYFPPHNNYENEIDDQDSEVLRVEAELKQLEREEFERQRENMLFREKLRQNRRSLENICDTNVYPTSYADKINYRKSMPELEQIPLDYRKLSPDVPNYKPVPGVDYQYRKSMPDIQHAYNRSVSEYCNNVPATNIKSPVDYRKSMPELQQNQDFRRPPPPINRQPIMPGKPLRLITKDSDQDRVIKMNSVDMDTTQHGHNQIRSLTRHSLHLLNAVPKLRRKDNWLQSKVNNEAKNYDQHWLYQEAELRRISEQNAATSSRNWPQPRQEQHIPDSVIQTLTQRVQNRSNMNGPAPAPILRSVRPEHSPNKEYIQHPYMRHQTYGHAQPMSYPLPIQISDKQDEMLIVSGKKKCSNCGNELDRRRNLLRLLSWIWKIPRLCLGTLFSLLGRFLRDLFLVDYYQQRLMEIIEAHLEEERERMRSSRRKRTCSISRVSVLANCGSESSFSDRSDRTVHTETTITSILEEATFPASFLLQSPSVSTIGEPHSDDGTSVPSECPYIDIMKRRGAAMIIESLCLFYHMECFKCCVCHMRLGDGRMGTDVRVRNQKLHCHNCYSSEDGVKFSCV